MFRKKWVKDAIRWIEDAARNPETKVIIFVSSSDDGHGLAKPFTRDKMDDAKAYVMTRDILGKAHRNLHSHYPGSTAGCWVCRHDKEKQEKELSI